MAKKKTPKGGSGKKSARPKSGGKSAAGRARTPARKKRGAQRPSSRRAADARPKARRGSKSAAGASPSRKSSPKKSAKKKLPPRKTATRRPKSAASARGFRRRAGFELLTPEATRGLGPETGGQSGDNEGLSRSEIADSESVEELLEEGQAFEAGIVSGVENAPDADESEVRTRQFPEDDVPREYLDED
jgi:hypothetical protein